jgi:hypothetical protein
MAKKASGKAALEAVGPNTSGVAVTPKGYPRSTFKASKPANTPKKLGSGKVQMGSK